MANASPPKPPVEPQGAVEAKLWQDLQTPALSDGRSIVAAAIGGERRVTGDFLRWLLIEGIPGWRASVIDIKLDGLLVSGKLDLAGNRVGVFLIFLNCEFDDAVVLTDATVPGLTIRGGRIEHIHADRLAAGGAVEICAGGPARAEPIVFRGQLRLNGAKIRGNLDLRACRFAAESNDRREPTLFADGLTVEGNMLLRSGASVQGEVCLNGSDIRRNLDCQGASFNNPGGYTISAAGAHIAGTVYLCAVQGSTGDDREPPRPFSSNGIVRLEGAKIDGELNCENGTFTAADFLPTDSSRSGNQIDEPFCVIQATGAIVGGDVSIERAIVRGCIVLMSAEVGGDLRFDNSKLSFPGEVPLCADSIVVNGASFFENVSTDGVLRFVQADLKQGFYVENTKFQKVNRGNPENPAKLFDENKKECRYLLRQRQSPYSVEDDLEGAACGIHAPQATVAGTFILQNISKANPKPDTASTSTFWLYLPDARANDIQDDPKSWESIERCDISGTSYASVTGLSDDTAAWRLRELDRHYASLNAGTRRGNIALAFRALLRAVVRKYGREEWRRRDKRLDAATKKFKPQPYTQLAETFRRAGFENSASTVLVRLERNRTRYSDFGVLRQSARWALDFFLLYGHSPFRPLLFVLIWAAFSTVLFQRTFDAGGFVSARETPPAAAVTGPSTAVAQQPAFNAAVYAIDTLVPIVDFNQKKSWVLKGDASSSTSQPPKSATLLGAVKHAWRSLPFSSVASTLLIFNTFFGWLMTTLFAAGVTGLTRTK